MWTRAVRGPGADTKRSTVALFLLTAYAAACRGELVTGSLLASLDTGSLAGTRFSASFSYDSSQVQPAGDSYVQLHSFDLTLLGVTASFQVILPANSPVRNITFGFGGPGVIGYIDLNEQYGSGSFLIGRVHLGTIVSIRRVGSSDVLAGQPGIEIQLFSDDEFPVRDEIMALQIGARQFFLSGYPDGDLHTVVFTLTAEEFAVLSRGDPVIIQYGIAPSDEVWQFGAFDEACPGE